MGRGIEIHDGHIVIPAGEINKIALGTEALPITQQEAGQVVVSAVINATALGGAVKAGNFGIIATVNLIGDLQSLRSKVTINDGITVTGSTAGARIATELLGTGINAGRLEGLLIEMSSSAGSETTTTVYGIFISNYNLGTQSPNNYAFLRLQENGTYTIQWGIYMRAGPGGIEYFACLHGTNNAWASTGSPTVQAGWIRVQAGGVEKWIALYSVAP